MFSGLFGFNGRIGRGGWWFGYLMTIFCSAIGWAIIVMIGTDTDPGASQILFLLLAFVVNILAMVIIVCSTVKRYHDRGKSGWWFWLGLIPIIGGIWQFIELGFCSGDDGDNEYGSPPGAEQSRAELGREVSSMASGSLSKLDDNYLAEYARKMALDQASQQSASANNFGQNSNARPVFGKR
jgi:uncharacterized membrane protein YhaH (DUF805 family)